MLRLVDVSEEEYICDICDTKIPPNDVLQKASEQVNRKVTFINFRNETICPNCIGNYLQHRRIFDSEEKLLSLYMNALKMHTYSWSDIYPRLDTDIYVNQHMKLAKFRTDALYSLLTKDIFYRDIKVKEIHENYQQMADSVLGVGLPTSVQVPSLRPNLIECPQNEMGLIYLPRNNDFIIMVKSCYNKLSVLEQSLNEMRDISRGKMSPRAGAAGGVMLTTSKCRSLSKITENDKVLCVRNRSTALSVTYRNRNGEVKGRNAVYKDLFMTRYSSKQKFKLMIKSQALQRLSIMEMISRLRSFMLLDLKKIIPIEETLQGFMTMSLARLDMEKKFNQGGRTPLESKLLSWACSTGEMRNHEAVKSHFDGNKCHPVETMSLFGRTPVNAKHLSVDNISLMPSGYLVLPLEGVTVKIDCGFDLLHCKLKSTLHLADNSRNTCNWSRVHGP